MADLVTTGGRAINSKTRTKTIGSDSTPHDHRSDGFTLIELLVVVVILGILIAIAIPVYLNYKKSANDKAAQSDLRGTVAILEQCLGDNNAYPATATFTSGASVGSSGLVCAGRTGVVSSTTTMSYFATTDQRDFIVAAGAGTSGSSKTYCYSSAKAGQVTTTSTPVAAYRATC